MSTVELIDQEIRRCEKELTMLGMQMGGARAGRVVLRENVVDRMHQVKDMIQIEGCTWVQDGNEFMLMKDGNRVARLYIYDREVEFVELAYVDKKSGKTHTMVISEDVDIEQYVKTVRREVLGL
jgi:hypothetical protein